MALLRFSTAQQIKSSKTFSSNLISSSYLSSFSLFKNWFKSIVSSSLKVVLIVIPMSKSVNSTVSIFSGISG